MFQRNGKNLHHDQYISFADAALGATAEVPLLGGKAKIKIDAGTQSGKIVRLRGKGPSVDSYGNGDLLINLNVDAQEIEQIGDESVGRTPRFCELPA